MEDQEKLDAILKQFKDPLALLEKRHKSGEEKTRTDDSKLGKENNKKKRKEKKDKDKKKKKASTHRSASRSPSPRDKKVESSKPNEDNSSASDSEDEWQLLQNPMSANLRQQEVWHDGERHHAEHDSQPAEAPWTEREDSSAPTPTPESESAVAEAPLAVAPAADNYSAYGAYDPSAYYQAYGAYDPSAYYAAATNNAAYGYQVHPAAAAASAATGTGGYHSEEAYAAYAQAFWNQGQKPWDYGGYGVAAHSSSMTAGEVPAASAATSGKGSSSSSEATVASGPLTKQWKSSLTAKKLMPIRTKPAAFAQDDP